MGKFVSNQKVSLASVGEGWADAYLTFKGISFNESLDFADLSTDESNAKASADKVLSLLQAHFVDGKGWNGTELVDITSDDLGDLPVSAITESLKALAGTINPNS